MKITLAFFLLFTAYLAFASSSSPFPHTNPDGSITMEQEGPEPSIFESIWNRMTKYYRYAKRSFTCYMWNKDCRASHTSSKPNPTLTVPQVENDFGEQTIEQSNWFEKSPQESNVYSNFPKSSNTEHIIAGHNSVQQQNPPVIIPKEVRGNNGDQKSRI